MRRGRSEFWAGSEGERLNTCMRGGSEGVVGEGDMGAGTDEEEGWEGDSACVASFVGRGVAEGTEGESCLRLIRRFLVGLGSAGVNVACHCSRAFSSSAPVFPSLTRSAILATRRSSSLSSLSWERSRALPLSLTFDLRLEEDSGSSTEESSAWSCCFLDLRARFFPRAFASGVQRQSG